MFGEDDSAGKALASKPDNLSSVLSEGENSHMLSSDFHILAVAHRYIHRHMHTHSQNHAKTLKINMRTYIQI